MAEVPLGSLPPGLGATYGAGKVETAGKLLQLLSPDPIWGFLAVDLHVEIRFHFSSLWQVMEKHACFGVPAEAATMSAQSKLGSI